MALSLRDASLTLANLLSLRQRYYGLAPQIVNQQCPGQPIFRGNVAYEWLASTSRPAQASVPSRHGQLVQDDTWWILALHELVFRYCSCAAQERASRI